MPLTKRDKVIIADLNQFRCMSRDDIAELHFKGLNRPNFSANNVLLRLLREGHIQRSTAFIPYVYFGQDVSMKKNSAKTEHFLAILNVYKEILQNGNLTFSDFCRSLKGKAEKTREIESSTLKIKGIFLL